MGKNGNGSHRRACKPKRKAPDIGRIFADGRLVDKAMQSAVRAAILDHKRAGNPICVWRNGKVVWIPPEKIKV